MPFSEKQDQAAHQDIVAARAGVFAAARRSWPTRPIGWWKSYCPRTRSTQSDGLILRWTLAGSRRS